MFISTDKNLASWTAIPLLARDKINSSVGTWPYTSIIKPMSSVPYPWDARDSEPRGFQGGEKPDLVCVK